MLRIMFALVFDLPLMYSWGKSLIYWRLKFTHALSSSSDSLRENCGCCWLCNDNIEWPCRLHLEEIRLPWDCDKRKGKKDDPPDKWLAGVNVLREYYGKKQNLQFKVQLI